MSDKNAFGGGNKHSLYVPMSEVEQEVLARLAETKDFRIHLVGWGIVNNPRVIFGDARLSLQFRVDFTAPDPPGIPVYYFDLELRTGAGLLLFKDRQPVMYGGKPVTVSKGVYLDFAWDIAIQNIDPAVVKAIKPGAKGLTSRLQDKDTGEITRTGNMRLNSDERMLLEVARKGEARAREDARKQTAKAEEHEKKASGKR